MRLARDGFCVVILDKDEKAGREVLAELRGRGGKGDFFTIDLTKLYEVQGVFENIISDLARVDVLVNLTGGTSHKRRIEDLLGSCWGQANLNAGVKCWGQANLIDLFGRRPFLKPLQSVSTTPRSSGFLANSSALGCHDSSRD